MGLLSPLLPEDSYLAGGTALALHLNHRQSYDLDIYTPQMFDENLMVRKLELSFRLKNISGKQVMCPIF